MQLRQALAWPPCWIKESNNGSSLYESTYFWLTVSCVLYSLSIRPNVYTFHASVKGVIQTPWLSLLLPLSTKVEAVRGIFLWGGLISKRSSVSLLQTKGQRKVELLPWRRSEPKLWANGGAAGDPTSLWSQLHLWPRHLPEVCREIKKMTFSQNVNNLVKRHH